MKTFTKRTKTRDMTRGTCSLREAISGRDRTALGAPRSARQFASQVDDLVKATNRWSRKDYLRVLNLLEAVPHAHRAETEGKGQSVMSCATDSIVYSSGKTRATGSNSSPLADAA